MASPTAVARSAPVPIAGKGPLRPKIEIPSAKEISESSASAGIGSSGGKQSTDPRSSKSRKERPCDACRRRKSKCVTQEEQSVCVSCLSHEQNCTFVESPQPRKRKLNTEAKEDSATKRRSPDRLSDAKGKRSASPSSNGASNCLVEDMANLGGPTLLRRTLGLQNDRYSQYIGPTTDIELSLIDLSPFDPQDESLLSRGTLRKVSNVDTFLMLPDHTTPGYSHVIVDVDAIESLVAPHGRTLIDLYFKIVHPNFPILQKQVFLEKYERSYREFSPPILAAVYIIAINWWNYSDTLAGLPKPDIGELERLARTTLADAMYRPKLSTVQAGLLLSQRPEGDQWAPTGQLVTIGQELGLHLDPSTWKIPPWERGLRKRLAWALYMQDKWGALVHGRPSHIFATNWAVPALTPNDFAEDDCGDWAEGGAENDDDDDADADAMAAADAAEAHAQGRLLFAQMIKLSRILAEVLETFYTLSAMADVRAVGAAQGVQLVLAKAKPVQLKLKEWFAALPPCLRMDGGAGGSGNGSGSGNGAGVARDNGRARGAKRRQRLSSIGSLHLAYFATEITLHRRIIRSLHPNLASAAATSSSSSSASSIGSPSPLSANSTSQQQQQQQQQRSASADAYVQYICRSAAKTRLISAMDFINRLTPAHHLAAFWYFASKSNFALLATFGNLLWATAPGAEEARFYERRLEEYRWTLGVSARGGDGMRGMTEWALAMLDMGKGLVGRVGAKKDVGAGGGAVANSAAAAAAGGGGSGVARGATRMHGGMLDLYGLRGGSGGGGGGGAPAGGFGAGLVFGHFHSQMDVEDSEAGSSSAERRDRSGLQSGLASPSTSTSSGTGGSGGGVGGYF